jgi:hypothetical protein
MNRESPHTLFTENAPLTTVESGSHATEVERLKDELDHTKKLLNESQRLVYHYRAVVAFLLMENPVPIVLKMLRVPGVGNRMKEEMAEAVGERLDAVLKKHFDPRN